MSGWEGGKTQLPLRLSPVLLLKEREGGRKEREREEGEAGRLLAPSVHVFCIPALIFTQSEAGVLSVQMKGRGGAFWGCDALRGEREKVCACVSATLKSCFVL